MAQDPSPAGKTLIHRAAAARASGSLAVLPPPALLEAIRRSHGDLRLVMREPTTGGLVVVVTRAGEPTMVFSPGDGRSVGELFLAAGLIDQATLARLVEERPQGPSSLERLVREHTTLTNEEIQRFLDFQARMRLLDVLVWREGFFELEEYSGGGETAFRLQLPNLASLVVRAQAREAALPRLLDRLPAPAAQTVVRRRRAALPPADPLEVSIFAALEEPLLVPQLIARLLVDDDLVIGALLEMVSRKVLVAQARAALAAEPVLEVGDDPRRESLLRQVLEVARGPMAAQGIAALWVVVVSASPEDATQFVTQLGGEPGVVMVTGDSGAPTGLVARTVRVGGEARLCLMAVRPEALSRGALEGVLARCDAVILVRSGKGAEELEKLQHLRRIAEGPGFGWRPFTLGLDLGSGLRAWGDVPDAILGIYEWRGQHPGWLLDRLLEGLLAAATCRASLRS